MTSHEIRDAIKATNLPIRLVAYWLGVSVDTVRRWCNARSQPRGPALVLLREIRRDPMCIARSVRVR